MNISFRSTKIVFNDTFKQGLNMRLLLFFVVILTLSVNACSDSKAPEPSPSSPASGEYIPPATATAEPTQDSQPAQESPESVNISQQSATTSTEPPAPSTTTNVADAKSDGLELARKSGCLACHAIDKKVVGPAWKDVAKRYTDDANAKAKLTEKVAKGGRGNWSDVVGNVAMPPYSPRVSEEDIEKLVSFVLSLETQ